MKTELQKLIKKGNFIGVDDNITQENFPMTERRWRDYKMFDFGAITSEKAVKKMRVEGYEPANIYELMDFNDSGVYDFIVALGSVVGVGGYRLVPCLGRGGAGRELYLGWWVSGWDGRYRFLAVRNLETKKLKSSDTLTLDSLVSDLEKIVERYKKG